jgi:hypothetical protein
MAARTLIAMNNERLRARFGEVAAEGRSVRRRNTRSSAIAVVITAESGPTTIGRRKCSVSGPEGVERAVRDLEKKFGGSPVVRAPERVLRALGFPDDCVDYASRQALSVYALTLPSGRKVGWSAFGGDQTTNSKLR